MGLQFERMSDSRSSSQAASPGVVWDSTGPSRAERAGVLKATGATMWFTGLSASGKSTIAAALERKLISRGVWCYRLDGDNLRHGLNADLGFDDASRHENNRRAGEVAKLFADAGLIVLASFISPYRADRDRIRALHRNDGQGPLEFLEVFVDAPVGVCESRDPKGLYRKARAGELTKFTGISDPYEAPLSPELVLRTAELGVDESVAQCEALLRQHGCIP